MRCPRFRQTGRLRFSRRYGREWLESERHTQPRATSGSELLVLRRKLGLEILARRKPSDVRAISLDAHRGCCAPWAEC